MVEEVGAGTVIGADPNGCVGFVQAPLVRCQKVRGDVEDV